MDKTKFNFNAIFFTIVFIVVCGSNFRCYNANTTKTMKTDTTHSFNDSSQVRVSPQKIDLHDLNQNTSDSTIPPKEVIQGNPPNSREIDSIKNIPLPIDNTIPPKEVIQGNPPNSREIDSIKNIVLPVDTTGNQVKEKK